MSTTRHTAAALIDAAHIAQAAGFDTIDADTVEELPTGAADLWEILGVLEAYKRAVNLAIDTINTRIAADVDTNGPVRLGDYAYTVGRPAKRELIDWRSFAAWAGDDLTSIVSITARNVRITGVRALAERRYRAEHADDQVDDDVVARYVQAVEDTFFDTTREEEPKLLKVPASRRKWATKLNHGEHLPQKRGTQ